MEAILYLIFISPFTGLCTVLLAIVGFVWAGIKSLKFIINPKNYLRIAIFAVFMLFLVYCPFIGAAICALLFYWLYIR